MKKNPTLLGLIITIGIVIGCYVVYGLFLEKKDSYLIANPSEEMIKLKIDGQDYSVAPKQITQIKLKGGEHKLQFNLNGKQTDTTFTITRYNALINPTRADYYIFVRPYG